MTRREPTGSSRSVVEAFIDEWLALPMFAGLAVDPDDRRHRLAQHRGRHGAQPASAGTGAQDRCGASSTTWRAGARAGRRARRQVQRRSASGWQRRCRMPTFAVIPGAGHAAHNEQPVATRDLIAGWLSVRHHAERQPDREQRAVGELDTCRWRRARRSARVPDAPPPNSRIGGTATSPAASASNDHGSVERAHARQDERTD